MISPILSFKKKYTNFENKSLIFASCRFHNNAKINIVPFHAVIWMEPVQQFSPIATIFTISRIEWYLPDK